EVDGDPLVVGGVDLARRCPGVEQDVLEAAQRHEGAPVVGAQVVDAGLHERGLELPLRWVTVQRLAVEEAIDGMRHVPRIVRPKSPSPACAGGQGGGYLTR